MTIPIRNLYYLFCYAWERYPEGGATEVGIDECPDLPNLFARVLINGVNRLLRRGLDRGYLSFDEERTSPRGRLLLDRTIKEQTLKRGAVYCLVDDLRRDILHNQIIKATALLLARDAKLERSLAHELRLVGKKLGDVSDIRLTPDLFRKVQLFRNNRQYVALMRLCEFICRAQLPEEAGLGSRFADIQRDEERMSRVFEDFLRNFYVYEQATFSVAREDMRWRIDPEPGGDPTLVPIMRTDVTLRSSTSTIVIDAKFYADPFPRSSGVPKFRSAHLYQLFAYMKHASDRGAGVPVRGALVYAAPDKGSVQRYRMDGHEIAIAAIDLSRSWSEVHEALLGLLGSLSAEPTARALA
jgi:5-methylcytosine-specific restriction enzyme subunit McrC